MLFRRDLSKDAELLRGQGSYRAQPILIWFVRLLPFMTYLTRLTSTCFTESRCRASHSTMGTSGPRLSAILMSAAQFAARLRSGFVSLRQALPMNIKAHFPGFKIWSKARADIDRIVIIWSECLQAYGGPFLFGKITMADAMYAPVVSRFRTYGIRLDGELKSYADRIWDLPAMQEWREAALAEGRRLRSSRSSFSWPQTFWGRKVALSAEMLAKTTGKESSPASFSSAKRAISACCARISFRHGHHGATRISRKRNSFHCLLIYMMRSRKSRSHSSRAISYSTSPNSLPGRGSRQFG